MILRKDLREVKKFGGKVAVRSDLQRLISPIACLGLDTVGVEVGTDAILERVHKKFKENECMSDVEAFEYVRGSSGAVDCLSDFSVRLRVVSTLSPWPCIMPSTPAGTVTSCVMPATATLNGQTRHLMMACTHLVGVESTLGSEHSARTLSRHAIFATRANRWTAPGGLDTKRDVERRQQLHSAFCSCTQCSAGLPLRFTRWHIDTHTDTKNCFRLCII